MKVRNILPLLLLLIFVINIDAQISSASAIQKLIEGNKRFVESKLTHLNETPERRTEIAKGQKPFAVIVSCSDSRVPPEIIFDQGLGDLFVIRSAGNLVDDIGLGSIEYAVEHLGVGLVVVLGHERCGAVDATAKGGKAPGHINALVKGIQHAVREAKKQHGDLLDNAVIANVKDVVAKLKKSEPILEEFVHEKKLEIIGARYDLDDGQVTIIK